MDHLTKQQVILLALLVSFVTAISTGITTVSLMDQSEQGVSQTIYKVVERTIEKVVAEDSPVRKIVETPKKEEPKEVVLSISDVAEKSGASVVRINKKNADTSEFLTLAVKVGAKGNFIAFTNGEISKNSDYSITVDNQVVNLKFEKQINPSLAVFSAPVESVSKIPSIVFNSTKDFKIGSNIIALGGKAESDIVSTGIVKELSKISIGGVEIPTLITDIKPSSSLYGWILLSTKSELVGFLVPPSVEGGIVEGLYIDANLVVSSLGDLI